MFLLCVALAIPALFMVLLVVASIVDLYRNP